MTGRLFNLPPRTTKAGDSLLAQKSSKKNQATAGISIKGGGGILERIATINAMVSKNLGKYADRYEIIRDEKDFEQYIEKAIKSGIIAIDTETNSLDPITCTLAGLCLYVPGSKAVYIPLNHVSYVTGVKIDNQVSEEFSSQMMEKLAVNKVKIIMFNAKFDIRVIKNQLGIELISHWDAYLGARLLNENEPENNLKALHKKYCMMGEGDAFGFDSLFKGIPFTHIPVNTGYLYAARDAEITYELYQFQKPFLTEDDPICRERDLTGPAYVFNHIEMPLINIVAQMEDTGVAFDFELAESLSVEYNKKLEMAKDRFYKLCDAFGQDLDDYRERKGVANKLEYPINISSAAQIAIMLYDILKIKPVDKEKPRGTGEEILQKIDHPVVKAILEYRTIAKLLSTYIEKMPAITNPTTKRIHASFNQIGADTGRFSSSDPNMQNIPSHNDEIRKMFKASDGYVLLSSDYSAQEPRLTAHMSQDEKMIKAYRDGKDLYVEIASIAYNLPYDECKEFRADGTKNPKGKERRGAAKAIVLGVCYGKGVAAIGEDLGVPKKKAQEIYDKVMTSFPGLKQFMIDSEEMAREQGFVTTVWGRKRRLPKMQLPPYEFSYIDGVSKDFDPLFDEDEEAEDFDTEVDEQTIQKYLRQLNSTYSWKEKEQIKANAKEHGILIKDNGGYIAEATRQCVNSRIQGSAADQTKLAMILVGNNQRLKDLGFRLLLAVHDELIGECPKENAKEVAHLFSSLMVEAAKDLAVPSKCDVEITERWYGTALQID